MTDTADTQTALAGLLLAKIIDGANSGEGVTLDAEECDRVILIMQVLKVGGESC